MKRGTLLRGTAAAVAGVLCLASQAALPVPASGSTADGKPVRYVLTKMQDGWYETDEDGNIFQPQLMPDEQIQPKVHPNSLFPSSFDMRYSGWVTSIKRQYRGTCWAYAALGAVESNMIRRGLGDASLDLSEAHLLWFSKGQGSPENPNHPLFGDSENFGTQCYIIGGNIFNVTSTLAAWEGVVPENFEPWPSAQIPLPESERFNAVAHLQNMLYYSPDDLEGIKRCLMANGGMNISFFAWNDSQAVSSNGAYYQNVYVDGSPDNPELNGAGHSAVLIGWDNKYSKDNFTTPPPEDGAWIIKSSWGEDANFTDDGYMYLSYYDPSIREIVLFNMESADNYSSIYQYDGDNAVTYTTGYGADHGFVQANVFRAEKDENVTAVGFYTNEASMPYEISVYALKPDFSDPRDGTLMTRMTGTETYMGYHTVDLPASCGVRQGGLFSVVIKTAAREQVRSRYDMHCFAPRTSYYTIYQEDSENGEITEQPWKDCYYDGRGNNTIKAFTTDGIGLNETFCPDKLLRDDLAKRYDTDKNLVITEDELQNAPETTPYDITGDGLTDARELTLLKRVALGEPTRPALWCWSNADLNADYRLNEGDVQCLMNFLFEESFTETEAGKTGNTAEGLSDGDTSEGLYAGDTSEGLYAADAEE